MKPTKIQESYTVNGKTFDNLHDAEKYRDELDAKNFDKYPKSTFDEVVYEIYTHHGDHSNAHNRCNGAFPDAASAYKEMQNHSDDWRSNGTGWMEQVVLKNINGKVVIQRKKIYEN
jgi:hypothetical protein